MNKNHENPREYSEDTAPGAEEIGAEAGPPNVKPQDNDVTAPGADRISATDSPHNKTVYDDDSKPAGVDDEVAPGAANIGAAE